MNILYKPFLVGFFCAILTIIQAYFSMGQYANELSSACIKCSFNEVLIKYVILIIFVPVILIQFFLEFFLKKEHINVIVITIYLIFVWLKLINTDIFETRVSDWSSFSNADIDSFVFKQSFKPILICTVIYLLFHLMLKINTLKKSLYRLE